MTGRQKTLLDPLISHFLVQKMCYIQPCFLGNSPLSGRLFTSLRIFLEHRFKIAQKKAVWQQCGGTDRNIFNKGSHLIVCQFVWRDEDNREGYLTVTQTTVRDIPHLPDNSQGQLTAAQTTVRSTTLLQQPGTSRCCPDKTNSVGQSVAHVFRYSTDKDSSQKNPWQSNCELFRSYTSRNTAYFSDIPRQVDNRIFRQSAGLYSICVEYKRYVVSYSEVSLDRSMSVILSSCRQTDNILPVGSVKLTVRQITIRQSVMKPVTRQADSQLFKQSSDRQKFSYTYNYQKGRESVNQTIIRKIESPFVR